MISNPVTKTITVIFAVSVLAAVLMGGLVLSPIAFAGNGQVTICHKPGTPAEQTTEVDSPAVPAHLAHGDTLGPCEPSACIVNEECPIGDVCVHPIGEDPLAPNGVCGEPSGICLLIFEPVCGVDGNTYTNSCFAAGAGVNIAHAGVCNND